MNKTFEKVLIEQCAPTLADIKPANLFRYQSPDSNYVFSCVKNWNKRLSGYGIDIRVIKACPCNHFFLIYVFRKKQIEDIMAKPSYKSFLSQMGYRKIEKLDDLILQLSHRLCVNEEFPHEIGVFLGYPLEDVIGFIENGGKNFTCCGHWKSYGPPAKAQKCFLQYRKCTETYKRLFERGMAIEQLVMTA